MSLKLNFGWDLPLNKEEEETGVNYDDEHDDVSNKETDKTKEGWQKRAKFITSFSFS
jgi:hypothetical protein